MPHCFKLYKSITADRSQVCDGRSPESLSRLKDELQLERSLSSTNLNVTSYTVSCNEANGEIKSHCHVTHPYRPISRKSKLRPHDNNDALESSPDDVNAISKVTDWLSNNFDLNRQQPPKMPFDKIQALSSGISTKPDCIKVRDPSLAPSSMPNCRRSLYRSTSLPTDAELEMWKTGQSHLLSPPVKIVQRPRQHEEQQQLSTSPPPPPSNVGGITTASSNNSKTNPSTPSKLLLRKKCTPQHRSPQINRNLSSIMKTPKYSVVELEPYCSNNATSDNQRNTKFGRSNSTPPLGPLPEILFGFRKNSFGHSTASTTESVASNDSDEWIAKGVDFMSNAEVYVFKR